MVDGVEPQRPQGRDDPRLTPSTTSVVPPRTRTHTEVDDDSLASDPAEVAEVDLAGLGPLHGSTEVHRSVTAIVLERGKPAPHQRTVEGELNPELAPDLGALGQKRIGREEGICQWCNFLSLWAPLYIGE